MAEQVDDYRDDFEDYDDDFEEVEFQAPAPPKQQSTLTGASKKKSTIGPALSDLEAIQDAVKNENSDMANRAARIAATWRQGPNDMAATKKESGGQQERGKLAKCAKSAGAKQAKYAAARPTNPLGSLSALNPVVRRARSLRACLTLVSERYVAFDQPPLTEYQLYRLRLRSAEPYARECTSVLKTLIF